MKMKTTIAILFVVALAGCMPAHQVIKTTSVYNPEDGAYIHEEGNAVIEGQAFLRTTIGEVRTCAGSEVHLIPVTEYSTERMQNIYGNIHGGRSLSYRSTVDEPDPLYLQDIRGTTCDAEGDYRFTSVPSGEYFVVVGVWWQVPQSAYYSSTEGANLMKRIRITDSENEPIRVLLH